MKKPYDQSKLGFWSRSSIFYGCLGSAFWCSECLLGRPLVLAIFWPRYLPRVQDGDMTVEDEIVATNDKFFS